MCAECVTHRDCGGYWLYARQVGRQPRCEYVYPGGTYHAWSRGSNREPIYFADRDNVDFLHRLGRTATKYEWQVMAYCLLTNHYHLVIYLPEGGLSEGMKELNGGFSRRTSVHYGRSAHLFRNRFGCTLIETDEHLLEACRYVVRNPIEAGLCDQPDRWRWSSYRFGAWADRPPAWLAISRLLGYFRQFDAEDPRRAYRRFV